MTSAIKKCSLREVCDWLLQNSGVINLRRDFPPNYLYAELTQQQRSGILDCWWCTHRKYFLASTKSILGHPPENVLKASAENMPQRYSKASAENIFGHPPKIFWPIQNNFYATRLTRCDRFGFGGFNPGRIFIVLGNLKHS